LRQDQSSFRRDTNEQLIRTAIVLAVVAAAHDPLGERISLAEALSLAEKFFDIVCDANPTCVGFARGVHFK
jgi:hypothetical protein